MTSTRTLARSPRARLDRANVRNVLLRIASSDLQLEYIVPSLGEHLFRFGNISTGVAACERPGDGQPLVKASPQQLRCAEPISLSERIDQSGLDRTFREVVSLYRLVDRAHCRTDTVGIALQQDWCDVGVDRELHALGALRPVG